MQYIKQFVVYRSLFIAKGVAIFLLFSYFFLPTINHQLPTALAIVDPLSSPNNKFGIHLISPTHDEASPAAQLVNSSGGDWGYVTILIKQNDRDKDKWQKFFDDLRHRHLIPIVRLATEPEGNFWKVPNDGEENIWAQFLNNLNWPTKNRYVVIYNEPNQGQEWGGKVNAASYAQVLDKTIAALKHESPDFFVLNAGLDASAPQKLPLYEDEFSFLREMNQSVPGIFNKLDGWVSHSYPNPGFAGSPQASGRGTVKTWAWEITQLQGLGVNKKIPIFITETGWKHAEGLDYDKSLPSSDTIGNYFKQAFEDAWNNPQIVAVTPFLLTYQDTPFDHFSFKKLTGENQNQKILGASYPEYYPQYQAMLDLIKSAGHPRQDNKAQLIKGEIYGSLVSGETYKIPFTFKNTGQSIWGENGNLELRAFQGAFDLDVQVDSLPSSIKVEPGQEVTFNLRLKAPKKGNFQVSLQLFHGSTPFDQTPIIFNTEVKSPVVLWVKTNLAWRKNSSGEYILSIISDAMNSKQSIYLDAQGITNQMEARYLLPDYTFDFTIYKPFYKPKTLNMKVKSGVNNLNFGTLEPDFFSALFKPMELWKLMPFSN